jgi:hypothetical protein
MGTYLYTLVFDVYLNNFFRVPAIVVGLILTFVFMKKKMILLFGWELLFLLVGNLFYYLIGQADLKSFFINFSIILTCGLYFNYFIGESYNRFKASVVLFVLLLSFSVMVMFADRSYPDSVDVYRATLLGAEVLQTPSGISATIFEFGYQMAAVTTLVFLYFLLTKKHFLLVLGVFLLCMVSIFFGMQRSAFAAFSLATIICVINYYRAKAIPIITGVVVIGALFFAFGFQQDSDSQSNILAKNTQNEGNGENRSGLMFEDLKIYSNYPLGLVFYNLQWSDVSKSNPAFNGGLTSHNAYLMFFTYLGPFLSIILFLAIYKNIYKAFKQVLLGVHDRRNALFVALSFAFFAVSVNSLFHNAWLLNADGPTVFLYFSVLHFSKTYYKATQSNRLLGVELLMA